MGRSSQPQCTANPKRGLGLNTESAQVSHEVRPMEVSLEEVIVCERENEALRKVKKCKEDRKSEMSGIQEAGMQEIRSLGDCR